MAPECLGALRVHSAAPVVQPGDSVPFSVNLDTFRSGKEKKNEFRE